jgi:hypothetical protein
MIQHYLAKTAKRAADEAIKRSRANAIRRRSHTPGRPNALAESRQANELDAVLKELYPSAAERALVDPTLYRRFMWAALDQ